MPEGDRGKQGCVTERDRRRQGCVTERDWVRVNNKMGRKRETEKELELMGFYHS